jgi:peptide deformylase
VDVVLPEVTPLEADLSYSEHPIKVLDQKDRVTRHKTIKFFKIQRSNHSEKEATWESEDFFVLVIQTSCCHSEEMCDCSLFLLRAATPSNSRGEIFIRGEGCDTPSVTVATTVFKQ